jgi:hypothetical protein
MYIKGGDIMDKGKKGKGKVKTKVKDKDKSTIAPTTTEEASKKKQPKTEETPKKKATKKPGLEKKEALKDTSEKLPSVIKERKIVCKEMGAVSVSKVEIDEIVATSKYLYVDDIHSANPKVLQTVYWVIMPDSRLVVARISEDEYNYLRNKGKKVTHHVAVVDCSVVPTLTYGAWIVEQLKKDFPSPAQIAAADEEFKKNPTNFHNPPVRLEIVEAQEEEKKAKAEAAAAKEKAKPKSKPEPEPELELDFGEDEDAEDEEGYFDFSA